mgnify:FL=1
MAGLGLNRWQALVLIEGLLCPLLLYVSVLIDRFSLCLADLA